MAKQNIVGYAYDVDVEIELLTGKNRSSFPRPWQKIIDSWIIMKYEDNHTTEEAAKEIVYNIKALLGKLPS